MSADLPDRCPKCDGAGEVWTQADGQVWADQCPLCSGAEPMSADLPDRLRDEHALGYPPWHQPCIGLMAEAADEIDRLRAMWATLKSVAAQRNDEIDKLRDRLDQAESRLAEGSGEQVHHAQTIRRLQLEIDGLKAQAAEDIIWMSGIGPIPDEALESWQAIQDRWLR